MQRRSLEEHKVKSYLLYCNHPHKIIIIGDFIIHIEVENNSLSIAFNRLQDFIWFCQRVTSATHGHNHISLDTFANFNISKFDQLVNNTMR